MTEFFPGEEWLELAQDPRYLVSTRGRLYSTHGRRMLMARRVGPRAANRGRRLLHWRISIGGRPTWVPAARAVLLAFVGPPSTDTSVAAFKDGDPDNLALPNLEWGPWLPPARAREMAARANEVRWRVKA